MYFFLYFYFLKDLLLFQSFFFQNGSYNLCFIARRAFIIIYVKESHSLREKVHFKNSIVIENTIINNYSLKVRIPVLFISNVIPFNDSFDI